MAKLPASRRWISPRPSSSQPALDTAVRFLAQRPRSEYEVRQRLRRAGVDDEEVQTVLDQLKRHHLLDDQAFAEYWVEQRQTFRPRGARLLRAELAQHGVPRAVAEEATSVTPEGSEEEGAFRVAAKRAAQLKGLDAATRNARLGAYLARRGFEWDTISTVLNRLSTS